jgi:CrcB protein
MPTSLIAIAIGAVLGAWARWGLGLWLNPLHRTLPIGTLAANWIGGYVIGVAVAWFAANPSLPPAVRLMLITGFLGALTTFSTFSAEVVDLLSRQQYGWAIGSIALHVTGSLVMTTLGILSVRAIRYALSA